MTNKYKKLIEQIRDTNEYWAEIFIAELTECIFRMMKAQDLTQKKLAEKLLTSEAYISKVLNGRENLSIKNITRIAGVLGAAAHVHLAPKDTVVEWIERSSTQTRVLIYQSISAVTDPQHVRVFPVEEGKITANSLAVNFWPDDFGTTIPNSKKRLLPQWVNYRNKSIN